MRHSRNPRRFHPSKEGFKGGLPRRRVSGLARFHPSKEGFKERKPCPSPEMDQKFPSL